MDRAADTSGRTADPQSRARVLRFVVPLAYDVPPAWPDTLATDPDWRAAIDMGIDVFLLEANLALTPAQRIRQLADMLALCTKIQGSAKRT